MSNLQLQSADYAVDGKQILKDINLSMATGEFVILLGANGAGKSSLLRCALGLSTLSQGTATLNQTPISNLDSAERARHIAYLPQQRPVAWPLSVFDVVSLGRYAFGVSLGRLGDKDLSMVEIAIAQCELESLRDRRIDTLSGGEAARVHCARAFAANAEFIFADEPTAALDPKHQIRVMQLIRDYVDQGRGALVVAHEANLAARFADRLVWLSEGQIINDGSVKDTMTEEMMARVYGVSSRVTEIDGNINVSILDAL